jgi:hypothetical protein
MSLFDEIQDHLQRSDEDDPKLQGRMFGEFVSSFFYTLKDAQVPDELISTWICVCVAEGMHGDS